MAWALRARAPAASLRTSHSHLRAPVCDRSGGRASIDRAAAHLSGGQRWQRGRGRQVMALNWLISWLWHADGDCEAVWLPPTKSRARELARVLVVPRRRVSARHRVAELGTRADSDMPGIPQRSVRHLLQPQHTPGQSPYESTPPPKPSLASTQATPQPTALYVFEDWSPSAQSSHSCCVPSAEPIAAGPSSEAAAAGSCSSEVEELRERVTSLGAALEVQCPRAWRSPCP